MLMIHTWGADELPAVLLSLCLAGLKVAEVVQQSHCAPFLAVLQGTWHYHCAVIWP